MKQLHLTAVPGGRSGSEVMGSIGGSYVSVMAAGPGRHGATLAFWSLDMGLGLLLGLVVSMVLVLASRRWRRAAERQVSRAQTRNEELERVNASLRRSEERYRELVQQSPVGIYVAVDDRLVFVNPELMRILGATEASQLVGQEILAHIHPSWHEAMAPRIRAMVDGTATVQTMVVRWVRLDGTEVEVMVSGVGIEYQGRRAAQVVARDLTEQRASEQALRAMEDRFQRMAGAVEQLFWFTSIADRKVLYLSPSFSRIWGISAEEVYADPAAWVDLIHPDDRARVMEAFDRCHRGESEQYRVEYRICRRDGEERWVLVDGAVIRNARGEAVQLSGIATDITERKRADQALAESEQRLLLALEAAEMGTFDWEVASGRLIWSPGHERLWGFAPGEFEGRMEQFRERVHPEDLAELTRRVEEAVAQGGDYRHEYRVMWPDGSIHWVAGQGRLVRDGSGRAVRMVGVVREVTRWKLAEQSLRESQGKLSGIISSAMDAIITIDEGQRITVFNQAAERMFRIGAAEALGEPISRFIPARFREAHQQHVRTFGVSGETSRAMGQLGAVAGLRADGEEFPVEASISQIRTGGQVFYTVILRDVTERHRAERRQAAMMQELDHRVKNNLAAVLSLAEESLGHAATLEEFRTSFTGRIRALARTHSALAQSKWEGVRLGEIVALTLAPFKGSNPARIAAEGPELMLHAGAAGPMCMAIHELATNAAKHGSLSRAEGRIHLEWRADARQVEMTWTEAGGPATSEPTHRGLGLDLVHGFIGFEMGGQAEFEFLASGLVCRIRFPRRDGALREGESEGDGATPEAASSEVRS